jgi:hypothetical protein
MKVSFSKAQSAPEAVQPDAKMAVAPVAPPQEMAVGNVIHSSQLEGEFTARDMAVPRLKLGQKVGVATDENPTWIGTWIYDGALSLGPTARIIVVRLRKYYLENLEYGSDQKPQVFQTHAEAMKAGVQIKDVCDIDMLIECDADLDQFAVVDVGGKSYAPARYTVTSSAYGRTVGILLRDAAGWLKNDMASGFYTITSVKKTDGQNSWFTPQLKADGKVSDELRAAIREQFHV